MPDDRKARTAAIKAAAKQALEAERDARRAAFLAGATKKAGDVQPLRVPAKAVHLPAPATIRCGCGHEFPAELGKYGCPNCHGDQAPQPAKKGKGPKAPKPARSRAAKPPKPAAPPPAPEPELSSAVAPPAPPVDRGDAAAPHLHELFAAAFMGTRDAALAYCIATGQVLEEPEARRRGRELLQEPNVRSAIRRNELETLRSAVVQKAQLLADVRRVADRCMQAVPVFDKWGEPTGEYTFNAIAALKALELMADLQGLKAPAKSSLLLKLRGPAQSAVSAAAAAPKAAGGYVRLVEDAAS